MVFGFGTKGPPVGADVATHSGCARLAGTIELRVDLRQAGQQSHSPGAFSARAGGCNKTGGIRLSQALIHVFTITMTNHACLLTAVLTVTPIHMSAPIAGVPGQLPKLTVRASNSANHADRAHATFDGNRDKILPDPPH